MTSIEELAQKYDCFILDCDGVIWQGPNQIDESFKVIEHLESLGKQVFFFTNNSTKLVEDSVSKMKSLGYSNPKEDHIFGSAYVTAQYIKQKYPETRKAFVIGMKSLRVELERVGIKVVGADSHIFQPD